VIDNLRAGTARRIVKPGQVFNRIHVDDIARMLAAAIDTPAGHTIYNLSDDEPAPPQDVVAYAAELLGLPVPPDIPFEQAGLTGMAASFWAEAKRVSNARIKTELGVALDYPTYREGLRAIVAGA
jgi:nucleoside-diphosphate-sugar epimerase